MRVPRPKGLPVRIPSWAWKWLKWREHGVKPGPPSPLPAPVPMVMFDDTNVPLIPKNAQAVAGYVDGHFQTWQQIEKDFPNAKKVPIAVFGGDNGDALDVEPGDASVAQAGKWIFRQLAGWNSKKHDVRLPVIYTAASQGQALVDALTKAGLKYGTHYLWWSAHYSPVLGQHLCGPHCGFGLKVTAHATQWTDKALGKSLDESICAPGFFV